MIVSLSTLPLFYLSYDEPNADANWEDLKKKAPWAKRVHGVKGFDSAHKECARQSGKDFFLTVDADNIVDPVFFTKSVNLSPDTILTWSARNVINGLVYGNGGIKCWPVKTVLDMRTHEIADREDAAVDFCWQANYKHMVGTYSLSCPNGNPEQAFRAGFREGVKMCLRNGERRAASEFVHQPLMNKMRLFVWCSVGADIEYGLWAIFGARTGATIALGTDLDHRVISDYDKFRYHYWEAACVIADIKELTSLIKRQGDRLRAEFKFEIAELDAQASRFYKHVHSPPRDRLGKETSVEDAWGIKRED